MPLTLSDREAGHLIAQVENLTRAITDATVTLHGLDLRMIALEQSSRLQEAKAEERHQSRSRFWAIVEKSPAVFASIVSVVAIIVVWTH